MHIEEKFDKAFASKMRALIEEHEEAYEIGAWESFDANANGSKISRYKFLWVGLAASFVMGMFLTNLYTTYNEELSSTSSLAFEGESEQVNDGLSNKILGAGAENSLALAEIENLRIDFIAGREESSVASIQTNESNGSSLPAEQKNGAYIFESKLNTRLPAIKKAFAFSGFKESERRNCIFTQAKIGAQFSPFLALNNGSTLGWSTGLITEIPLVKNISLTAGFLLNNQTVGFEGDNKEGEGMRSRVKLLAMELPLNIKYNIFKRKKKEVSVSAGVSSIAYINQQFSDNPQFNNSTEIKPDSFNKVEPVRFVNLAAAVEFPIEKNLSVLVEPFVKMPLGTTTNRDIKFTNAGVNVRLNYSLARLN